MKKFFFILFALLILCFLLIGFIGLNLEYFLNHDPFKKKIQNYVYSLFGIDLSYRKVHLNLYKLKIEVEDLKAKGEDFSLLLPKGRFFFSKKKLLKGNFYPSVVYLKDPYLLIKAPKEKKPTEVQRYSQYLLDLSPLSLWIKNGTFEYHGEKEKGLLIKEINLLAENRAPQVLFQLNSTSNFFAKLNFEGRFNYQSQFFEGTLRIKKFDFGKLSFLTNKDFIKKSELDISVTLSFEKDTLNVGFSGAAPCLVVNNQSPSWICGFFQGAFVGNKDSFELRVSPLDMKYPEIKGEILFKRDKGEYFLEAGLKALNLSQIKEILSPYLPEEVKKEFFEIVKAGTFEEISFSSKGKTLEDLVDIKNIKVSGLVKEGEVNLAMLPLYAKDLEGKLSLEKGSLNYEGSALMEGQISSVVNHLRLNLLAKKMSIQLSLDFEGESKLVKEIAKRFVDKKEVFEAFEVDGRLSGSLEINGELSKPEITLSIRPRNTAIKSALLRDWVFLKEGEIKYLGGRLSLKDLSLEYGENHGQGISGEISLNNESFNLFVKSFEIKRILMEEFAEKREVIRDILEKYHPEFETLTINNLSFEGNLEKLREMGLSDLMPFLSFEGEVKSLAFEMPMIEGKESKKTLRIHSPLVKFGFKDGVISIFESEFFTENSTLTVSGAYHLKDALLEINGRGLLNKKLAEKWVELKEKLTYLKDLPLTLKSFHLVYSKEGGLLYKGEHLLGELKIALELKRENSLFIRGEVKSPKSNFNFEVSKKAELFNLFYEGGASFEEISELLEKPIFERGFLEGVIKGEINSTFFTNREKGAFSLENLPNLLREFLEKRPLKIKGAFTLKDLRFKGGFNFSGELLFEDEEIKGDKLILGFNNSTLIGNIKLGFKESFMDLKGNFEIKEVNLKERLKGEEIEGPAMKEESLYEKLISEMPIRGEITLKVAKLKLPTSHEVSEIFLKISKEEKLFKVEAPEIKLCNLNFYAEYEKNPKFQYLFVDLKPAQGDLLDLFSCLYPEEMPRIIFEGPFRLQGFFYTDGEKTLLENSYGKIEVTSKNGYMYRAPLIARVLGFLSPIDLFRGKIPNLENNLLPYEEMDLLGEFRDTSFNLESFFLSASGFRMFGTGPISLKDKSLELTFLVSPFKTLDIILENIPFFNKWILGKERMFIYIPIEVVGTYENPTIFPLHPASIGKGLFRFIFKFFGIQEDFFKKPENFEKFKKQELLKGKSENSLRR